MFNSRRRLWEPLIYSWLVRSTGNNLCLQLVSEVGDGALFWEWVLNLWGLCLPPKIRSELIWTVGLKCWCLKCWRISWCEKRSSHAWWLEVLRSVLWIGNEGEFSLQTLWLHWILNSFLEASFENEFMQRIRVSTYEFWGDSIQSVASTLCQALY